MGALGIILFLYREHQEITLDHSSSSLVESESDKVQVANLQPESPGNAWCGSLISGYTGINGAGFYQYPDGKVLPDAAPAVFREFTDWIEAFRSGQADLDEGMRLAQERRDSLKDLIQNDPELALRLGIPEFDREGLPESVVTLLEEHVSAKGDWQSGYQCFIPGQDTHDKFNRVRLGKRKLKAFTFGRRSTLDQAEGISIHGIAVDDLLAVHESPIRRLDEKEANMRNLDPAGVPIVANGVAITLVDDEAAQTLSEYYAARELTASGRRSRNLAFTARSGGHSAFLLQTTPETWDQAKAVADALNLRLAVINDAADNTAALKLLTDANIVNAPLGGGDAPYAWLGGTDEQNESVWKWPGGIFWDVNSSNGGPVVIYQNWKNSTPDTAEGEDYLAMDMNASGEGQWVARIDADANKSPYLIQFEHQPDEYDFIVHGKYYKFETNGTVGVSWASAKTAAEEAGGYLAIIAEPSVNTELFQLMLASAKFHAGVTHVWLGGSDEAIEGKWLWVDQIFHDANGPVASGVDEVYTNWGIGQPDDNGTEDHLAMAVTDWPVGSPVPAGEAGQWNDLWGTNTLPYLLQLDSSFTSTDLRGTVKPPTVINVLVVRARYSNEIGNPLQMGLEFDENGEARPGNFEIFEPGEIADPGGFWISYQPSYLHSVMQQVSDFYEANSYGQTTMKWVITETVNLPQDNLFYDNSGLGVHEENGTLLGDALQAAKELGELRLRNDWDWENYDKDKDLYVVLTSQAHTPGSYEGVAWVGAAGAHCPSFDPTVVAHEFGHNLGLEHSNYWNPSLELPTTDGTWEEYANPYSTMGSGSPQKGHFDVMQKLQLEWIDENSTAEFNSTYAAPQTTTIRLYQHDKIDSRGTRAIKIFSHHEEFADFWISYRYDPPTNAAMIQRGLTFLSLNFGDTGTTMVDFNPRAWNFNSQGEIGQSDHPLLVGRTYTDSNGTHDVHVTPIAVGYDTDGDRLSDYLEELIETNASLMDTDGDGANDYVEYLAETNASDPTSQPTAEDIAAFNGSKGALPWAVGTTYSVGETVYRGGSYYVAYSAILGIESPPMGIAPGTIPGIPFWRQIPDPLETGHHYVDVVVSVGSEASNNAPTIELQANHLTPRLDQDVEFTVAVTDTDTPYDAARPFAYSWWIDDQPVYGLSDLNQPTIRRSWGQTGEHLVRVLVSDMMGGYASDTVLIKVGDPEPVPNLRGRVMIGGKPTQGVRVFSEPGGVEAILVDYTNGVFRYEGDYSTAGFVNHTGLVDPSFSMDWQGDGFEGSVGMPNPHLFHERFLYPRYPQDTNFNGIQDATEAAFVENVITAERGKTYRFVLDETVKGHPMMLSASPEPEPPIYEANLSIATILVDDPGTGYTYPPTITDNDFGSTLNLSDANLTLGVVSITVGSVDLGTDHISNMVLWFDGNDLDGDGVGDDNSSNLSWPSTGMGDLDWADKAGLDHNATRNGNPTILAGHLNGKNVVDFNSSGPSGREYFQTGPVSDFDDNDTVTWFIVAMADNNVTAEVNGTLFDAVTTEVTAGLWGAFMEVDENGTSATYSSYVEDNASDRRISWDTNSDHNDTAFVVLSSIWQDDNDLRLYLNGTIAANLEANATTEAEAFTDFIIGGNAENNASLDGEIAEIIVFRGELTDNDRQRVEGYLAHKWGLATGLDFNHPYRLEPPVFDESGSGYTVPPVVEVNGSSANAEINATLAAVLTETVIESLEIINGGNYDNNATWDAVAGEFVYNNPPTIVVAGGGGGGASYTVEYGDLDAGGILTQITELSNGSGFISVPTIYVRAHQDDNVSTTEAQVKAHLAPTSLASVTVLDGGSGFTSIPSITISPADEEDNNDSIVAAEAIAVMGVASVEIVEGGNYLSPSKSVPPLYVVGGDGSGAEVSAVYEIHDFVLSVPGVGHYENTPDVSITGGGVVTAQVEVVIGEDIDGDGNLEVWEDFDGDSIIDPDLIPHNGLYLTNPGFGYVELPTITLSGGDGHPQGNPQQATLQVQLAPTGVSEILLTDKGSGYTAATTTVAITSGSGAVATAEIDVTTGLLLGIKVEDGGSGYVVPPEVTLLSGEFPSWALADSVEAVAVLDATGSVARVDILNHDTAYSVPPTVVFHSGLGAEANVTVVGGEITSINLLHSGSGYLAPPTITISDSGGGTGATATALLEPTSVQRLIVDDPGQFYGSDPLLTITDPSYQATATAIMDGYQVDDLMFNESGRAYLYHPTISLLGSFRYPESYTFGIGNSVTDSGIIELTITKETPSTLYFYLKPDAWVAGATYLAGDLVLANGRSYEAIMDHWASASFADDLNPDPFFGFLRWREVDLTRKGGRIVVTDGTSIERYTQTFSDSNGDYLFVNVHTGEDLNRNGDLDPGEDVNNYPKTWGIWEDKIRDQSLTGPTTSWDNDTTYAAGDIVSENGKLFIAMIGHVSVSDPGTFADDFLPGIYWREFNEDINLSGALTLRGIGNGILDERGNQHRIDLALGNHHQYAGPSIPPSGYLKRTGTAQVTVNGLDLNGTNTRFLTEFEVGDNIFLGPVDATEPTSGAYVIFSITDDSNLTLNSVYTPPLAPNPPTDPDFNGTDAAIFVLRSEVRMATDEDFVLFPDFPAFTVATDFAGAGISQIIGSSAQVIESPTLGDTPLVIGTGTAGHSLIKEGVRFLNVGSGFVRGVVRLELVEGSGSSNYEANATPLVRFTGDGTGATATATTGTAAPASVSAVTVVNGGNGYNFAPLVEMEGVIRITVGDTSELNATGEYFGDSNKTYTIIIDDATSDPNTFTWVDDGNLTNTAIGVPIDANRSQFIGTEGLQIFFGSETGHTLLEQWTIALEAGPTVTAEIAPPPIFTIHAGFQNTGDGRILSGASVNVNGTVDVHLRDERKYFLEILDLTDINGTTVTLNDGNVSQSVRDLDARNWLLLGAEDDGYKIWIEDPASGSTGSSTATSRHQEWDWDTVTNTGTWVDSTPIAFTFGSAGLDGEINRRVTRDNLFNALVARKADLPGMTFQKWSTYGIVIRTLYGSVQATNFLKLSFDAKGAHDTFDTFEIGYVVPDFHVNATEEVIGVTTLAETPSPSHLTVHPFSMETPIYVEFPQDAGKQFSFNLWDAGGRRYDDANVTVRWTQSSDYYTRYGMPEINATTGFFTPASTNDGKEIELNATAWHDANNDYLRDAAGEIITAQVSLVVSNIDTLSPIEAWRQKYFGMIIQVDANDTADFNDPDGDNLVNFDPNLENPSEFTYGLDPLNPDTDGDGLSDYDEIITTGTLPDDADTDDDGLDDGNETTDTLTNPLLADTDGDGVSDYQEDLKGSDPNVVDLGSVHGLLSYRGAQPVGTVRSISITHGGSGYEANASPQLVIIEGGGGSGALGVTNVSSTDGNVSSATVTYGGTGYSMPPDVVISGSSAGIGAKAKSLVSTIYVKVGLSSFIEGDRVLTTSNIIEGTVTLDANKTQVTGSGTKFLGQLRVGQIIYFGRADDAETKAYQILSIQDDTNLTLTKAFEDHANSFLGLPLNLFTLGDGIVALGATGEYEVPELSLGAQYYVSAFLDLNGNMKRDAGEAFGRYSSPIDLTQTVEAVDFGLFVAPKILRGAGAIVLEDGGMGYTTTPTINFGSFPDKGVLPVATIDLELTGVGGVVMENNGTNYLTPPTISIEGDATAAASLGMASVSILAGGSEYTQPPDLQVASPESGTDSAIIIAHLRPTPIKEIIVTNPSVNLYASPPEVVIDANGSGEGATAVALLQYATEVSGTKFYSVSSILLTSPGKNYTRLPTISFVGGDPLTAALAASAQAVLEPTGVGQVEIAHPGSGYSAPPAITVTRVDGSGSDASLQAAMGVTKVEITNSGSGYAVPPAVSFSDDSGDGAGARARSYLLPTKVSAVNLDLNGSGYDSPPEIWITPSDLDVNASGLTAATLSTTGEIRLIGYYAHPFSSNLVTTEGAIHYRLSSAGAAAQIDANGSITAINVASGGQGYTTAPVIIIDGDGSGATAIATLGDMSSTDPSYDPMNPTHFRTDEIKSITMTNMGSGYTKATVHVGHAPSDANGTVAISGSSVASVTLSNAGTGYLAVPNVTILGDGIGAEAVATLAADGSIALVSVTSGGSGYTEATLHVDAPLPGGLALNPSTGNIMGTPFKVGTYKYAVFAENQSYSSEPVGLVIHLPEVQAPIIVLLGEEEMEWKLGNQFIDPGANAFDYFIGNITGSVTVSGQVQIYQAGSYVLTYDAIGAAGRSAASVTRTVTVKEVLSTFSHPSPVVELVGDASFSVAVGESYLEPGATAMDGYGNDISSSVVISGSVDGDVIGQYFIIYKVTDPYGNEAQTVRLVTVAEALVLSGKAIDGYLEGATVIFDGDGDGEHDLNASPSVTDSAGEFSLSFTTTEIAAYDTDSDGQIDKGVFILSGGMDISTGAPFQGSLTALPGSKVVTPITTLLASLVQQDIDPATAESLVSQAFGIDDSLDLANYDPLSAAAEGDTKASAVLAAGSQMMNVMLQTAATIDDNSPEISLIAADKLANLVAAATEPLDLTSIDTISTIVAETLSAANVSGNPSYSDLSAAAQFAAVLNEMVTESLASNANDPGALAVDVARINIASTAVSPDAATSIDDLRTSLDDEFDTTPAANVFAPAGADQVFVMAKANLSFGATLRTISGTDKDVNGSEGITYSLVKGNFDYDADGTGAFEVNASTGAISVADSDDMYLHPLNYLELTVQLTDVGGLSAPVLVKCYFDAVNVLQGEGTSLTDAPGWQNVDWLGNFFSGSTGWIYHAVHGWTYVPSDSSLDSLWMWDAGLESWIWTNDSVYPYVYNYNSEQTEESKKWLYFKNDSSPRTYYDFAEEDWVTLP